MKEIKVYGDSGCWDKWSGWYCGYDEWGYILTPRKEDAQLLTPDEAEHLRRDLIKCGYTVTLDR